MMAPSPSPLLAPIFGFDGGSADQPALCTNGTVVTYGELRRHIESDVEQLRRHGVAAGDRLIICLPKSLRAVELILASLACGAAYVPVDHRSTAAMLRNVMDDIAPRLAIVGREQAAALRPEATSTGSVRLLALDTRDRIEAVGSAAGQSRAYDPSPAGLATVLYTSGSTGKPKGIMLTERNIASFVAWSAQTFALTAEDCVLSHAPLHFDLSLFDLFASFLRHATVHLLDDRAALFPGAVRALIDSARISVWYSVPTALARLEERRALAGAASLRLVMFAGEIFPTVPLRRLMAQLPQAEYVNLFGPTETNVCTYHRLPGPPASDLDAVPIGVPCEHLEVSLQRADGSIIGNDETGEICVAGPAVTAGYWGDAGATSAARFGGRSDSYRSGDYAYRRPDGALMFVGRRDQQVKIRGHRIDLLALEAVLHAHPEIREAVALPVPGARHGNDLALYLVARQQPLGDVAVRNAVAARLPPSYRIDRIEWLDELPRLANGKCDRVALRARAGAGGG